MASAALFLASSGSLHTIGKALNVSGTISSFNQAALTNAATAQGERSNGTGGLE